MRIGIVGAGPAGSLTAAIFARAGHEVTLFERKPGREKACGGGFTARTLQACSLAESTVPATQITELELLYDSQSVILPLNAPFRIYARAESDQYLLSRALASGAVLLPHRAGKPRRAGTGWEIRACDRTFRFDWLIGADGSHSCVRAACGGPFELADLSMTFGYYLPGRFHAQRAVVEFLPPGFEGYLWSFPRNEHCSVGVIHTAGEPGTKVLKHRVDDFLSRYYKMEPPPGKEQTYGAMVPTLRESTLRANCCAGDNWALVGDAGGFVDAITAEGIYFALRSARLLGQLADRTSLAEFDRLWREDFGAELIRSARVKQRFYHARGWLPSYAQMLLPLTRRSAAVRRIEEEFVAGRQGYTGLRRRVLRESLQILRELVVGNSAAN